MQNVVTMTVIIFGNSAQNQRKVITEPNVLSQIIEDQNVYSLYPEITCLDPTIDCKIAVLVSFNSFWQTELECDF